MCEEEFEDEDYYGPPSIYDRLSRDEIIRLKQAAAERCASCLGRLAKARATIDQTKIKVSKEQGVAKRAIEKAVSNPPRFIGRVTIEEDLRGYNKEVLRLANQTIAAQQYEPDQLPEVSECQGTPVARTSKDYGYVQLVEASLSCTKQDCMYQEYLQIPSTNILYF